MSSVVHSSAQMQALLASPKNFSHDISHFYPRVRVVKSPSLNLKSFRSVGEDPLGRRFHLFTTQCSSAYEPESSTIAKENVLNSDIASADSIYLKTPLEAEASVSGSEKTLNPILPLPDPEIVGPPLKLPEKDFKLSDSETAVEYQNGSSAKHDSDTETSNEAERGGERVSSGLPIENTSLWGQMKTILAFAGPALGIWLSNPLMSLIDTAIVGNGSSLELAALGPGTVVCDQISFTFMFLSVATSNLIATSMAQRKPDEAARHLSRLMFVALACGIAMIGFSLFCAKSVICAFVGPNTGVIPAACLYATIRGLAWPAILVTSVAQSASLGLQNAWDPLWVLFYSSLINFFGDILLCPILKMGIAGAAWATMFSQYVGCFLMLYSLHKGKVLPLSISIPSPKDLLLFINLAVPILLTMLGKTTFYTLLTYIATALGTIPLAAHQVMIGLYAVCAVCGEPLSQTAQSFLPELIVGKDKNLSKARSLVKSLLTLGLILGSVLAAFALSISFFSPQLFSNDSLVISEMQNIAPPLFSSLLIAPVVLSLEGTLLAGRDLGYLAKSVLLSLIFCALSVMICRSLNLGIVANWWTIFAFQLTRMSFSLYRLASPESILSENKPHLTAAKLA